MTRKIRVFFFKAALTLLVLAVALGQNQGGGGQRAGDTSRRLSVHIFWSSTCPHCVRAHAFLDRTIAGLPGAHLMSHELDGNPTREAAFIALSQRYGNEPPAVPMIVIGDTAFVGYRDEATTGMDIEKAVKACLEIRCPDVGGLAISNAGIAASQAYKPDKGEKAQLVRPKILETIFVPWFGTIETRTLSLPMLTILLGVIDGFNPCAMWVLLFLIGLLLGLKDRFRMWVYGATFLFASGAVYFAFMAAWLNIFLFLGSLVWIRAVVGLFGLAAATYYFREFIRNPDAACPVGTPGEKQRIMDRLRIAVAQRSFLAGIAGIIGLAIAVNLIELLCSAGIPAVYTQILALSELSAIAYFGFLALYIAVFMFDDAMIFVIAMLSLQATGLAASYSRWSHLIGGVVLSVIGLLLILKPEWLAIS